jgi:hypothetical protein
MRGDRNSRNVTVTTKTKLSTLHQNIQRIGNEQIEVDLALKWDLKDIDVLCFTERCLKGDCLKLICIDQYKLVSLAGHNINMVDHAYMGGKTFVQKTSTVFRILVQRRILGCLQLNW